MLPRDSVRGSRDCSPLKSVPARLECEPNCSKSASGESWERLTSVSIVLLDIGLFVLASVVLVEVLVRVFRLAPSTGIATVDQRQFGALPGIYAPGQRLVDLR